MTSDQVLSMLPNGFHDSVISDLRVDFALAEAELRMVLLVGLPDAETEHGREAVRSGVLRLRSLVSMHIEPPSPRYNFSGSGGIDVDGDFGTYPGDPAPPDDGYVRLWFYVSTWNAKMILIMKDCELEWTDKSRG